jgi:multiple sugar transport system permease protein
MMSTTGETAAMPQGEGRSNWWLRLADPAENVLAVVLLAPALLLLLLIIAYPIGRLIYTSFLAHSLTSGLPSQFIGLGNFQAMLDDPVFWETVWNTVLITLITVPGALVAGLILALMANLPFAVKWPVRMSLLIPWAMPLPFVGLIFAWFFHSQYGIVNDVLSRVGLPTVIWFNSPRWAFVAICVAIIWKTSSFVALIILAGLQTIPPSLYEAADVDGARPLRQFFEITLPLLRPSIAVALIFRTITALQTFDIPTMMTGGGPGTSTTTLAMYIHQNTVSFLDLGYGSALAVMMFVLSMGVTALYLRMLRSRAG